MPKYSHLVDVQTQKINLFPEKSTCQMNDDAMEEHWAPSYELFMKGSVETPESFNMA